MSLLACAQMVEAGDADRFAATMAAPVAARARLWPLYALNLEVARAAYASDEPLIAEMRLQWWVDEFARLAQGQAPQGDVSAALKPLFLEIPDLAGLLTALVDARRWDCWSVPFADRAAFDAYLDATAGNLVWAAALALGATPRAEAPARDFAYALGLANWFDAVPALTGRGRTPLPAGVEISALASDGLMHLAGARRARGLVPATIRPAFWPGWSARPRLRAAQSDPAAVSEGRLPAPRLARAPALLVRSLSGYW